MKYCNVNSNRHHLWKGILFVLCFLCHLPAKSDDYKPMLKDGRIWNYIEVYDSYVYVDLEGNIIGLDDERWHMDHDEPWFTMVEVIDTIRRVYHIDGMETIDDRPCYKLYRNNNFIYYTYEENGKVYKRQNEEWVEGFDFTLQKGETCPLLVTWRPWPIISVDTIDVRGTQYKRLQLSYSDDEGKVYWIESVGSTQDGPYFSKEPEAVTISLLWSGIMSVYDGETCLFERKDFHKPGINTGNIDKVVNDSSSPSVYTDLQGRRLNTPPARGIYLENNKKRMRR